MPLRMESTVIGGEPLRAWLLRAPSEFRLALFGATSKAVEVEARAIRELTPQLTGKMRGSIGTKVRMTADGVTGEVYSTDQATRFVEFGTRQHGPARRMFARGVTSSKPSTRGAFRAAVGRVASSFSNF